MEEESNGRELTTQLLAYFRRRNYVDADLGQVNFSRKEQNLHSVVDKDSSNLHGASFTNVISDFTQAEVQYAMLKSWVLDLEDPTMKEELMPLLVPLLAHIFLDSLKNTSRLQTSKFLKRYLQPPVMTEEWKPFIELLYSVQSASDADGPVPVNQAPSLLQNFRRAKFELKLSPQTHSMLYGFLCSKSLYVVIQILKSWFEIVTISDDYSVAEEENDALSSDVAEVEQEEDDDSYIDINDPDMESLVKEINAMRSQPTPPPPLLMYTAFRSEGTFCGRISYDCNYGATGNEQSEVIVWGLGERPADPEVHPSFFDDVELLTYSEPIHNAQEEKDRQWWTLRGHCDGVFDVQFVSNSNYLISVSFDTTMRLWSLKDMSCSAVYRGHSSPVWAAAVSPIANIVATASSDKTARIWSLDRTFPLRILAGHLQDVLCVAFHPNGSYVATGSEDRTVRLWSVTDGSMVRVFGGHQGQGPIETIAFSPNGQYAASAGSDNYVWMWDLAAGNLVYQLAGHTERITSLDWSNDGNTLAAGSYDGNILVWSLDCDINSGGTFRRYPKVVSTLLSLEYSAKNALVGLGLE